MADYTTSMFVPRKIEGVFAFVSDFRNAGAWDPLVSEASMVGDGPIGLHTSFLLVTKRGPLRLEQPYTIVELAPPNRVCFRGETWLTRHEDWITFAPVPGGTRIDYAARRELNGVSRLGSPILYQVMGWIGDHATHRMPAAIERGVPA
ncbi:SRPBCC family protein [Sorangium sp. So ce1128]